MSHCKTCNSILQPYEIEECSACISDRIYNRSLVYFDEITPFNINQQPKEKMKNRIAKKVAKRQNIETSYRKDTILSAIKRLGLTQDCVDTDNNYMTIKGIMF